MQEIKLNYETNHSPSDLRPYDFYEGIKIYPKKEYLGDLNSFVQQSLLQSLNCVSLTIEDDFKKSKWLVLLTFEDFTKVELFKELLNITAAKLISNLNVKGCRLNPSPPNTLSLSQAKLFLTPSHKIIPLEVQFETETCLVQVHWIEIHSQPIKGNA